MGTFPRSHRLRAHREKLSRTEIRPRAEYYCNRNCTSECDLQSAYYNYLTANLSQNNRSKIKGRRFAPTFRARPCLWAENENCAPDRPAKDSSIELIFEDSKGDPTATSQAFDNLVLKHHHLGHRSLPVTRRSYNRRKSGRLWCTYSHAIACRQSSSCQPLGFPDGHNPWPASTGIGEDCIRDS